MNALSAKKKEQIFSLLLAAAGHITSRWNVGCWRTLLSALRVFLPSFWSAHSPSNRRDLTPAAAASQLRERGNFSIIFNRVCVCVRRANGYLFRQRRHDRVRRKDSNTRQSLYTHTHTSRHSVSSFAVRLFERMPFSFLIFFNLVILLLILPFLFFSLVTWLTDWQASNSQRQDARGALAVLHCRWILWLQPGLSLKSKSKNIKKGNFQ